MSDTQPTKYAGKSIPLVKCTTVRASWVGTLGAVLPFVIVELGDLPPNKYVRVVSFVLGLVNLVLVPAARRRGELVPARGILFRKGGG